MIVALPCCSCMATDLLHAKAGLASVGGTPACQVAKYSLNMLVVGKLGLQHEVLGRITYLAQWLRAGFCGASTDPDQRLQRWPAAGLEPHHPALLPDPRSSPDRGAPCLRTLLSELPTPPHPAGFCWLICVLDISSPEACLRSFCVHCMPNRVNGCIPL